MRTHSITPEGRKWKGHTTHVHTRGWKWKGHATDESHTRRAQTFPVVSANCSLIIFHETEFSVLISDESTSWRNQGVKFAGIIQLQCWSWNREREVKAISMTNMLRLKPLLEQSKHISPTLSTPEVHFKTVLTIVKIPHRVLYFFHMESYDITLMRCTSLLHTHRKVLTNF